MKKASHKTCLGTRVTCFTIYSFFYLEYEAILYIHLLKKMFTFFFFLQLKLTLTETNCSHKDLFKPKMQPNYMALWNCAWFFGWIIQNSVFWAQKNVILLSKMGTLNVHLAIVVYRTFFIQYRFQKNVMFVIFWI